MSTINELNYYFGVIEGRVERSQSFFWYERGIQLRRVYLTDGEKHSWCLLFPKPPKTPPDRQEADLIDKAIKYKFPIHVEGTFYAQHPETGERNTIEMTTVTIPTTAGCLSFWKGDSLEGALSKSEEGGRLSLADEEKK